MWTSWTNYHQKLGIVWNISWKFRIAPVVLVLDNVPLWLYSISKLRRTSQYLFEDFEKVQDELFEELSLLEDKYEKRFARIYRQRSEVLLGIKEEELSDEDDPEKAMNRVFGIPNFWLTVMKRKDILAELITEDDEGALQYLEDIKSCRLDDSGGFMLEFSFSCTPYFKNSKLEKKYKIDRDGPVLIKARGTKINWHPGKCLTRKVLPKMARRRSNDDKPLTNTRKSFFNFFNPPLDHDDDDDEDEDVDEDDVPIELIRKDYDIGCVIRDEIIPYAVSWFTGQFTDKELFVKYIKMTK
ncbi:Nucleosome assembly protein [Vigna angularis]|uniref:Nucleosome assembly protein n=1 Tax=Phaseolus angularis TaxID=3914 RepID=A0A8T0JFW0_PHAAN|nr:Nucleosome assembly protein [Vigna angularis]